MGQVSDGTSHLTTNAIPQTVKITKPNAKNEIGLTFFLNSFQDVKYAAANKIGGRKTKKITSLSNSTTGTPGMRAMTRLPTTSVSSSGR